MTISRTRSYIASNPRFSLARDSTPSLQKGQMTMVFEALAPYPTISSLEELASRCSANRFELTFKRTIPPDERGHFLRMSILYHLKRMKDRGMIRGL